MFGFDDQLGGADGVGARRSATKSAMVKSVSCPTAEMTGISDAAMVRARPSLLNAQRSSTLPPPRATMMTSTAAPRVLAAAGELKYFTPAATSSAAPSP